VGVALARVLTWHVHGSYLLYLSRAGHELVLPVKAGRPHPYGGRAGSFPWPANVVEVPADHVRDLELDVVLYQSEPAWTVDRYELLSHEQRALPSIYLEHDPPRESPFDTRHHVREPGTLVVHVTHFNRLMWDCGEAATAVIEHGVEVPEEARWTGELERGLVIVNNLASRGRRLGLDVFEEVRERVPLDLVGMGSEELGGLGEIPPPELPAFAARYRFLFNPIRWTSLGLAVCEALHVGLPVVGLATTEMSRAIENGVSGFVDTNVEELVARMLQLLDDRDEAAALSEGARQVAREHYGIERFAAGWTNLVDLLVAGAATGAEVPVARSSVPSLATSSSGMHSLTRSPLST
jgi:glycosyltransferase involved in cell wall biosynthesis